MMGLRFLCRVAFFGISVHSLAFPGPKPTAVAVDDNLHVQPDGNGWTPKPTTAPSHYEVLRRQNSKASTYFAFPDNTCGFVDMGRGSMGPYSCDASSKCAFLASSPGTPGAVGCCSDPASCFFRVGCMDLDDLKNCQEDCMGNASILKCSRSSAPSCNTVIFPGGTTDYYCATRRGPRIQIARLSTARGASRVLTKVVITPSASPTTRPSSTVTSSSVRSASTSSIGASKSDPGRNIEPSTPADSDSSTISAAPAATSSAAESTAPAPAPASASSNTGAIAGGIVGGLAGFGLIVFAILFFLRRKKNDKESVPSRIAPSPEPQRPPEMSQNPSLRPSAPSPVPSNPFNDPPSRGQENASISQLTNAFPMVPEPLNLSRPGTATATANPAATANPIAITTTTTTRRPITPSQFSPLSAVTIAAIKASENATQRNTASYPEPSPMSTPSGSPKSAHFQPPDTSSFYPNYPQYRPPSSRSQSGGPQSNWSASPTRRSPPSTYSAFPVSPVSGRGSNPPERREKKNDDGGEVEIARVQNVPLILQPGLGMQRLAPGTVKQVTVQRGASTRKRTSQVPGQGQAQAQGQGQGQSPTQAAQGQSQESERKPDP